MTLKTSTVLLPTPTKNKYNAKQITCMLVLSVHCNLDCKTCLFFFSIVVLMSFCNTELEMVE